jgi:hypothetical protein
MRGRGVITASRSRNSVGSNTTCVVPSLPVPQAQDDALVGRNLQPIFGDRRPQRVSAQTLQAPRVSGGRDDRGVQIELQDRATSRSMPHAAHPKRAKPAASQPTFDSLGTVLSRVEGPLDLTFRGQLRSEQVAAANALVAHDAGVLAATTAFGKTSKMDGPRWCSPSATTISNSWSVRSKGRFSTSSSFAAR